MERYRCINLLGNFSTVTNKLHGAESFLRRCHSASQDVPRPIWNPKFYHRDHSPQLVPVLSQMHPVHTLPPCFLKIHSNFSFPSTPMSSKLSLPFRFQTKMLYTYLISLSRATWPTHLTLLDFIALIIFDEAYKLQSFSLCSLVQPPAPSTIAPHKYEVYLCKRMAVLTYLAQLSQSPWFGPKEVMVVADLTRLLRNQSCQHLCRRWK
jgi:hypothetical protein